MTTTDDGLASLPELRFEHARIVEVCRTPVSVVEVAAALAVPLGVARVLVSDLHSVQHAGGAPDGGVRRRASADRDPRAPALRAAGIGTMSVHEGEAPWGDGRHAAAPLDPVA